MYTDRGRSSDSLLVMVWCALGDPGAPPARRQVAAPLLLRSLCRTRRVLEAGRPLHGWKAFILVALASVAVRSWNFTLPCCRAACTSVVRVLLDPRQTSRGGRRVSSLASRRHDPTRHILMLEMLLKLD